MKTYNITVTAEELDNLICGLWAEISEFCCCRDDRVPYETLVAKLDRIRNPLKVVEIDPGIRELVDLCGGHCPCAIERTEDTLCPCKEFREQTEPGECRCGRFAKVVVE